MRSLPGSGSASVSPALEVLQQWIPVKMSPVSENEYVDHAEGQTPGNWLISFTFSAAQWRKALSLGDKDLLGPGNLEVAAWQLSHVALLQISIWFTLESWWGPSTDYWLKQQRQPWSMFLACGVVLRVEVTRTDNFSTGKWRLWSFLTLTLL